MPLPRSRTKINKLFLQIKDESLRIIISDVVSLEHENRSSLRFPTKKIEDIIDKEANLLEQRQKRGEKL